MQSEATPMTCRGDVNASQVILSTVDIRIICTLRQKILRWSYKKYKCIGHTSRTGDIRNAYRIFPEGKIPLETPGGRCEDDIKNTLRNRARGCRMD